MTTAGSPRADDALEAAIQRLVDRSAIAVQLANHSRGIDRRDTDLLKSVYHPEATVDYGVFEGAAHTFCEVITDPVGARPVTLHRTSNLFIQQRGSEAWSECYVIAYMAVPGTGSGTGTQALIQGRYLDRHACRQGRWKLAHRTYVLDWFLELPGTGTAIPGVFDALPRHGDKSPDDPVTRLIAEWRSEHPLHEHAQESASMTISPELLQDFATTMARNAIHDLIMTQARATDRGDLKLLQSVWHAGATVDVGFFTGTADDFCPMIIEATTGMIRMSHTIANEWIEVRSDQAVAESYVIAFTTLADESGALVSEITGGRYLDKFESRNGTWKYTARHFVTDWQMRQPATMETPDNITAQLKLRGRRDKEDPVYAHWRL